jgi:fructose-1,6-bisphosphatase/sedoheptulose 1,7-bisphosphatase-like protein
MRLDVTGSNATWLEVRACADVQRIHDWMTGSGTSPEGLVPSSKKRCLANAMRCAGVVKNNWLGTPESIRVRRGMWALSLKAAGLHSQA